MRESPGVQPGPADWFLPSGASRQAGPIKHQLVFGVLASRISAQKPAAAIAYTGLL